MPHQKRQPFHKVKKKRNLSTILHLFHHLDCLKEGHLSLKCECVSGQRCDTGGEGSELQQGAMWMSVGGAQFSLRVSDL